MDEPGPNTWKIGPVISPALEWGEWQGNSYHRCRICNIELLTVNVWGFAVVLAENNSITQCPSHLSLHNTPHLSTILIFLQSLEFLTSYFPLSKWRRHTRSQQYLAHLVLLLFRAAYMYRWLWPNHDNSAVHWLLYDCYELYCRKVVGRQSIEVFYRGVVTKTSQSQSQSWSPNKITIGR